MLSLKVLIVVALCAALTKADQPKRTNCPSKDFELKDETCFSISTDAKTRSYAEQYCGGFLGYNGALASANSESERKYLASLAKDLKSPWEFWVDGRTSDEKCNILIVKGSEYQKGTKDCSDNGPRLSFFCAVDAEALATIVSCEDQRYSLSEGKCYFFGTEYINHTEAESRCGLQKNGHLAPADTAEEYNRFFWMITGGGSDTIWTSGKPVKGMCKTFHYNFDFLGSPTGPSTVDCSWELRYMCVADPITKKVKRMKTYCPSAEWKLREGTEKCYFVSKQASKRDEAISHCESLGGSLAPATSRSDIDFLSSIMTVQTLWIAGKSGDYCKYLTYRQTGQGYCNRYSFNFFCIVEAEMSDPLCPQPKSGGVWKSNMDICYFYSGPTVRSWEGAGTFCEAINAKLAVQVVQAKTVMADFFERAGATRLWIGGEKKNTLCNVYNPSDKKEQQYDCEEKLTFLCVAPVVKAD